MLREEERRRIFGWRPNMKDVGVAVAGTVARTWSGALIASVFIANSVTPCNGCHAFVWTVSRSATEPLETVGPPTSGEIELYLWLWCAIHGEMLSAEFGFGGSTVPTEFIPAAGFENAGTATDLRLSSTLCPSGNKVAGTIKAIEPIGGGDLCIILSSDGNRTTTPCPPNDPTPQEIGHSGYSSLGPDPCGFHVNCGIPDAVDESSWGHIKAEYR